MRHNFLGFVLPESLIARHPLPQRDCARLLVGKTQQTLSFFDFPSIVNSNDLIIFNDTRVQPVRVYAKKYPSGGAVEFLFTQQKNLYEGLALYKSSHRLKIGQQLLCQDAILHVVGIEHNQVQIQSSVALDHLLLKQGHVPLPPYLRREDSVHDRWAYQTGWAKSPGSSAAPTASLHFTPRVLRLLEHKGVQATYCTLHVGLGTFLPVKGDVLTHKMHAEYYEVPERTLRLIEQTKQRGGRVIAVGTTVTRALESAYQNGGVKQKGLTEIFMKPGYRFNIVDAMITNFHQVDSTLILLVQAFAGIESIKKLYCFALKERYRLYSYGDAMFLEYAYKNAP